MNVEEIKKRCRVVCAAEAVAMDFPAELGEAVFDGCIRSDSEDWDEADFLAWVIGLSRLPVSPPSERQS